MRGKMLLRGSLEGNESEGEGGFGVQGNLTSNKHISRHFQGFKHILPYIFVYVHQDVDINGLRNGNLKSKCNGEHL